MRAQLDPHEFNGAHCSGQAVRPTVQGGRHHRWHSLASVWLGFNLTAILTGVGIGGIAVAFAAQKTLDNLFGGIMLITDQPMRIGDLCKAGDHLGQLRISGCVPREFGRTTRHLFDSERSNWPP